MAVEKIFAVSGMTGATPWHVTDQGLMLKTITTYRIAGGNMGGIKMEFCPIPFSDPCTPSATHYLSIFLTSLEVFNSMCMQA